MYGRFMNTYTWIQDACNHAGYDDQPQWKKLEVSSENATRFSVRVVLGGQSALHNHLQTDISSLAAQFIN